jgi:hypothetical protein
MTTFEKTISNQPLTGINRKIVFKRFSEFDLANKVIAEFDIIHSINNVLLPELDKTIRINADGTGDLQPAMLDIVDGEIVVTDYTMVKDIEFLSNWLWADKGLTTLFHLLISMKDNKVYDIDGDTYTSGTTYSAIDLKYKGLIG